MASSPSVDTAKQVLNRKWQALKPAEVTERNVLFQQVTSTGAARFQVTAILRDYSPGYPANHYYGQTCVSRIVQLDYTLTAKSSGEWDVDGRMTPDLSQTQCKNNPGAGVSSIPVQGLPGTPAPAGTVIPAAAVARSGGLVEGDYECWAFRQPRPLLNFSIRAGGAYTGSDGHPGAFSFDPSSQRIRFTTGALANVLPAGFYSMYYEPQGRPTVSFRNAQGDEESFCQKR